MGKLWYLMRYKYGQLDKFINHLKRYNINFLIPLAPHPHCRGGQSLVEKESDINLSPYIFVLLDFEEIAFSKINNLPGSNGFIFFGGKLKPIPDSVIDSISESSNRKVEMHKE